jgi:hypothetical protein
MKFGLDTLHEKGWFKSLAAVAGFLAVLLTIGTTAPRLFESDHGAGQTTASSSIAPTSKAAPTASSQRTLDDAFKQQLLGALTNKYASILIACARGDAEAKNYAEEIQSFLERAGYTSVGIGFTNLDSFAGSSIEKDGPRAIIKIGRRP